MTNPVLDMLDAKRNEQIQNTNQAPSQANNGLPTSLNDPRMAQVKDYVNSHGGNPKAAFYRLCKEKALNPANIINKFLGR